MFIAASSGKNDGATRLLQTHKLMEVWIDLFIVILDP